MGIDFDITEAAGPTMSRWTTMDDVNRIGIMDPYKSTRFVAEALKNLRSEVNMYARIQSHDTAHMHRLLFHFTCLILNDKLYVKSSAACTGW